MKEAFIQVQVTFYKKIKMGKVLPSSKQYTHNQFCHVTLNTLPDKWDSIMGAFRLSSQHAESISPHY